MKAELGMAVQLPNESAASRTAKANKERSNGHAVSKRAAVAPDTPAGKQTASAPPKKNHKARLRDRMRKQKAVKQQHSAARGASEASSTGDSEHTDAASVNRNTLKNKRKRAKEKAARQAKAALKASGADTTTAAAATPPPSTATTATDSVLTIDPSIRNSTKRLARTTATPEPTGNDKQRLIAVQQQSEANAAKFGAIAESFENGQKWYQHPECIYTPHSSSSASTIILSTQQQQRLQQMREKAQSLLTAFSRSVQEGRGEMTREDERWLKTVMTAGTLSDKIAGMQLLLSDRCVADWSNSTDCWLWRRRRGDESPLWRSMH